MKEIYSAVFSYELFSYKLRATSYEWFELQATSYEL